MNTIRIDYSALASFRSCPQRFINEYKLRLVNKTAQSNDALDFGNLVHFGLEIIGLSKLTSLPSLEECFGEIDYLTSAQPPSLDTKRHVLIQALHAMVLYSSAQNFGLVKYTDNTRRSLRHALTLMVRYVFHYHPETINYTAFEQFLEHPLGTIGDVQVVYCGTVDGASQDALVEHKTTSYLSSSFLERTNPSDQVTGYLWLFQQKFPERKLMKTIFDGISTSGYGLASKPSQWPINKEPEKLFLRTETYRTQDQLDDWEIRTLLTCKRVIETIQSPWLTERRSPDACTEFNSTCKFINLCRASDSESESRLRETMFTTQAPWKGFQID